MQSNDKAILFLREIREMVFLQKKNITKWAFLEAAAKAVQLNIATFKTDYEGNAKEWFSKDLKLAQTLGVRGFPTLFFTNNNTGQTEMVYGSKPYHVFETALLKLYPTATKLAYNKSWEHIFSLYHSLTAKEFSVLSDTERNEAEKQLNQLVAENKLEKQTTKNGAIWKLKTN